jgi:hypothetical protein
MDRYTFSTPSTIAMVVSRLLISAARGEQNLWQSNPPWKNIFKLLFILSPDVYTGGKRPPESGAP